MAFIFRYNDTIVAGLCHAKQWEVDCRGMTLDIGIGRCAYEGSNSDPSLWVSESIKTVFLNILV